MSILKGLNPSGARNLLTEAFRKGDQESVDATDSITELGLGRKIDITPIGAMIFEAMKRFDEFQNLESDMWLGPRIHATLRLTRREAADKRIWAYLTVVAFPNYVRWRWAQENPDEPVPLDRFFGGESKNALARLWWTVELTRNGTDYKPAEAALRISQFYPSWLGLNFLHHRPAALAAVRFLSEFAPHGATTLQTRVMATAANLALRTVCLDALAPSLSTDAEAVREWSTEKIDETTMIDELPKGPDETPVPEADIAVVRKFLDDLAVKINLAEAKAKKRGRLPEAEPVET